MSSCTNGIEIVLNPPKELIKKTILYFNRNIRKNAFPLITTNVEFKTTDADIWYEMQKIGRHIRAVAVNRKGDVIGAGYLNRGVGRKSHTARIAVTVDLDYRGRGIGTLLFKTLINEAKKVGIIRIEDEPVETNIPAIHILEKLGFKREGIAVKKARLDDGTFVNCIYMALILEDK